MSEMDNINVEFQTIGHYLDEIVQHLWKISIILSLTKPSPDNKVLISNLGLIEEMVNDAHEIITDLIKDNKDNEEI